MPKLLYCSMYVTVRESYRQTSLTSLMTMTYPYCTGCRGRGHRGELEIPGAGHAGQQEGRREAGRGGGEAAARHRD